MPLNIPQETNSTYTERVPGSSSAGAGKIGPKTSNLSNIFVNKTTAAKTHQPQIPYNNESVASAS